MTENKRVKWTRRALRTLAVVALAALAYLVIAPTGRYLLRGAWEEAKILARRRPLVDILADSATTPALRAKLQLVLAARAFAADSLGLDAGQSFTTYSETGRDTLTLVVSGAYRDRLKSYTWWFPVVGRVPYKGYFDFDEARRQERALNARGFDTRLGAVSAFSTLGWFNDPLLPSTLRADSLTLANTVIHELTHNTYYAPGGAVFNESFANFVGSRGAQRFFLSRGQSAAAAEVAARWEDEKVMGRFWAALYGRVDSAFKAHPGEDAGPVADRLAAREVLFGEARLALLHDLAPRLKTISIRSVERVKLDNAVLMSRRVYLTDLDAFDAVLARDRGDLRRAVTDIIAAAKEDTAKKPFDAVKRLAARPLAPVAASAGSSPSTQGNGASRDTVLLERELDGVAGADRLVLEQRVSGAPGPTFTERRVALYLRGARTPAWESGWNDLASPKLRSVLPLAGGGSLITIDMESGDGGESLALLARRDSARVVLRQGGDYDGWLLRVRRLDEGVVADVAGMLVRNDSSTTPTIRCPDTGWPGWSFRFDEPTGEFVRQRETCVPRS